MNGGESKQTTVNQESGASHLKQKEKQNMNDPNKQIQIRNSWLKDFGPTMLMVASLVVLSTALPAAPAACTQNYKFTTVDAPDKDLTNPALWTYINDSGLIIQDYYDTAGVMHTAALLSSGWTLIDVPGAAGTGGTNPNSQGQVALNYWGTDGIIHLAIWQRGHYTYIPDFWPGYVLVGANAFNDLGQITAAVANSAGTWLGFVGDSRHHTVFGYPGSELTIAFMTSDFGITVGVYEDPDGTDAHGFVYDNGHLVTLDVPEYWVNALAINNEGEIAGEYQGVYTDDSSSPWHGFLLQHGKLTDFDVPEALQTTPWMITDNHKLAGEYQAADGTWHGFVATPVGCE